MKNTPHVPQIRKQLFFFPVVSNASSPKRKGKKGSRGLTSWTRKMLGLVSIKVFEDYAAACRWRTIPKCQMIQRKWERESGRAFGIKQQRSNHSSEVIPKFQNEEPQIPRASFGQTTTCRSGMQPSLSISCEASMRRTSIPLKRWVDVRSHASLWWCTGTCFVVTEIKNSCRLK